jgi:GNAT superfamily N-acetyltransferase
VANIKYELRVATPNEAAELTELALRSKAHWGYDEAFMAKCRETLKVTAEDCESGAVWVAADGARLAGFCSVCGDAPQGKLSDLFIDPEYIGKGAGRLLLENAVERAKELGFSELEIHSDPHAVDFYLHFGAEKAGEVPSESIPGRTLPRLLLEVT